MTWVGIGLAAAMALVGAWLLFGDRILERSRAGKGPDGPRRPSREQFRGTAEREEEPPPPPPKKRAAIIINPTKVEAVGAVRNRLAKVALAAGWDEPLVLETTIEDPGFGQTRRALAQDVDLVCALGGDGTVRAVAQEVAGTGVPLGLLPAGTGNLLARNLDLRLDDLEHALTTAISGRNRHIDLGWAVLDPTSEQRSGADASPSANRHGFLVIAGAGLDATIMENTSEELKAKVGWTAYIPAGAKGLLGDRFKATVSVDGSAPESITARGIMVGNCGRIQGGIEIMHEAKVDDGILDVVAMTPHGLAGWVGVAANLARKKDVTNNRIHRYRGQHTLIELEAPQPFQVDGDVIGEARVFSVRVDPGALIVRVPGV